MEKYEAAIATHLRGCSLAAAARHHGVRYQELFTIVNRRGLSGRSKKNTKLPAQPSAEWVVDRACYLIDVSADALCGQSRIRELAECRMIIAVVLRRLGYSLPVIGGALGGRDHTTILYHLRRFDALSRAGLSERVDKIIADVTALRN